MERNIVNKAETYMYKLLATDWLWTIWGVRQRCYDCEELEMKQDKIEWKRDKQKNII
jgi:hypothetical protein